MKNAAFIISLDYELYWGIHDVLSFESYQENLKGTSSAISQMLELFKAHEIRATWATVGLLFHKTAAELESETKKLHIPYSNQKFSPFPFDASKQKIPSWAKIGPNDLERIIATPGQEIGTHTYSHFFCLEEGPDLSAFNEDMKSAKRMAESYNIELHSIVFPRNQIKEEFLSACIELGIKSYRGSRPGILWKAKPFNLQSKLLRGLRWVDSYINLTGSHTYSWDSIKCENSLVNLPASFFLRPYQSNFLDKLQIRRLKKAMHKAAKKGEIFHLWWHPHNFGVNTKKNMVTLKTILDMYSDLNKRYGMKSYSFNDIHLMSN